MVIINLALTRETEVNYSSKNQTAISYICFCCGGKVVESYAKYKLRCEECGLHFTDQSKFNIDQLTSQYAGEYWKKLRGGWKAAIASILCIDKRPILQARAVSQFEFINQRVRGKRFFEIGVGNGEVIRFISKHGYHVNGLEPDPQQSQKLLRFNVINLKAEDLKNSHDSYDIVFMSHVLEHVKNPSLVIQNCRNIIADNGILFIEVPNCENPAILEKDLPFWHTHLFNFTTESLRKLLHKNGLLVTDVQYVSPVMDLDNMVLVERSLLLWKLAYQSSKFKQSLYCTTTSTSGIYLRIIAKKSL